MRNFGQWQAWQWRRGGGQEQLLGRVMRRVAVCRLQEQARTGESGAEEGPVL